ncbi:MAG: hypothetical protein EG828_11365 [Deltaproteobacteria bacterium]|nr:hypothetical protein [Deltaproteobacteria bacterium]
MMTVSDGIAEEYHRNYGIRSLVITNAPPYHTLTPSPVRDQQIRLIHHGGAVPSRKLELMIEMMRHVDDRFTLDLMLVPSSRQYLKRLESLSQGIGNVRFVPPVPMPEIVSHINKYDMGLYILPDNSFNNWFALPNKIFEFIQARLGVAIGPSVEMARIVKNHGVGVVADSFKPRALAEKLNCLSSQDIRRFKERAHAAASSLSQESNCERLLGVIERLLGQAK